MKDRWRIRAGASPRQVYVAIVFFPAYCAFCKRCCANSAPESAALTADSAARTGFAPRAGPLDGRHDPRPASICALVLEQRGAVAIARHHLLQIDHLARRQAALLAVARVAHVRAPAQEVLDLALVAVRLGGAAHDRVQALVLGELHHRLAGRVAVAEADRLELAVVDRA